MSIVSRLRTKARRPATGPALIAAVALASLSSGNAIAASADGAGAFAENCSACHQLTGKGVPGAFPALAGDALVRGPPAKVVLTLLNGRGGMPSFRNDLSDAQIAAAISYIRTSWGNHAPPVDAALVAHLRGGSAPKDASAGLQAH